MAKRSGHGDHRTRGNPYYEDDIPPALASAAFTAKTFELRPALVAQDGTSIQPHDGAPFDATQFRLRFNLHNDNDKVADYIKFFSGNADAASQPTLIVEYHLP